MNYEEAINNQPGKMIEKLVSEIGSMKAVDIRFEFEENEQWAVVSVYIDDDNELALRLLPGDSYILYVGYYDEEDELREISKPLTDDEKKLIPKGLQKVMGKVLTDEAGLRVPGGLLLK